MKLSLKKAPSLERVRQLLQRALRKLRYKGKRDIEKGNNTTACASLLLYVGYGTDPGTQLKDKFMAFDHSALPALPLETHALPLLAGLCLSEKDACEFLDKPALRQRDYAEQETLQASFLHVLA